MIFFVSVKAGCTFLRYNIFYVFALLNDYPVLANSKP